MAKIEMRAENVVAFGGAVESMRDSVSAEEWALRQDLAALYRIADLFGWSDLLFTHFSLRIPGPEHHFLINPFGWLFGEVTASSLVKVDQDGNKVDNSPFPVNPAGFAIHSAIHAANDEAQCVMHLHTPDGAGVSAQAEGLLPISQQGMIVCDDLAYYDYGGPGQHADEGKEMAAALGTKHFALLRNHGTLTIGRTCADAFMRMYFLERACSIQVRAQAGGRVNMPNQGVAGIVADASLPAFDGALGKLVWPSMLRKADKADPSYRD